MLRVEGGGGGKLVALSHGMADLVSYGDADRDVEQVFFTSIFVYFYQIVPNGTSFCSIFEIKRLSV